MMRSLVPIAIVVAARTAAADPCTASLPDAKPTKLGVHLDDGLLVADAGARFPAISSDGARIAALFDDSEDFSDAKITTLVVWSKTGARLGEARLGGRTIQPEAERQRAVASANKLLAGAKWRELKTVTCDGDPVPSVELKGGLVARIDDDGAGGVHVGDRAAKFPAPGRVAMGDPKLDGKGCGSITGIKRAFGTRSEGIVVVVPRRALGGDSCFGATDAELAIAVRTR
jgi:hypothetical protein